MNILDSLIIQPFSALLRFLYFDLTHNYGLAIIVFAIVIKLILFYFSARGKKAQLETTRIQPQLKELQVKYKNDKVKYNEAMQKLYQEENVSMTGGCLWSLLPFPILIAFYSVIQKPFANLLGMAQDNIDKIARFISTIPGLSADALAKLSNTSDQYFQLHLSELTHHYYPLVEAQFPDIGLRDISYNFLGLNLAEKPALAFSWMLLIPLLAGVTAYLSFYLSQKANPNAPAMQGSAKTMMMLMPLVSVYFGFAWPALVGLYWTVQNVLGGIQDYFLTKHYVKKMADEIKRREEFIARKKAAEEAMKEEMRLRRAEELAAKKAKRKPGQTVYKVQKKPDFNKNKKS